MIAFVKRIGALLAVLILTACASTGYLSSPHKADPFEQWNRKVYAFNDAVDSAVLKPVAKAYTAVVPELGRDCVSNFFDNLRTPFSALNNLLQGKPKEACTEIVRFVMNSTAGLAGCFDVATAVGVPKHKEDFGQTLAVWGVGDGPFLMLPFFGPSTLRDGIAVWLPPSPNSAIGKTFDHVPSRNTAHGMNLIDTRAGLLPATDALEKMEVDKYSFIRNAYLQKRKNDIYDGDPPDEDEPPPKKDAAK